MTDLGIKRALVIVNPASRRGAKVRDRALEAFEKAGVMCDLMVTKAPGHAAELAASNHSLYDAIFTLGGDGTLMEVLGAVAETGPPVGALAGGTANVMARTLGIPLDPRRAIPLLLAGDEARIDLGRLGNGRRFALGLGVGLDATMIELAPRGLKKRLGFFAYVIGGFRAAVPLKTFQVRLTVDGEVIERTAAAVLVTNFGAVLNDLVTFGDGIRYDDGLLNACVFSPANFWDAQRILWRLIRKDFRPTPTMLYRAGKEFRIETFPARPVQADGEILPPTPVTISVEPKLGRLLVPRKQKRA
ncbi:MAG: diacylglycerol kinase family lipid kinase [Gemmatimonadaceae bacterium]|nr:diacylglycerol kinase family lipid kinase [Gemmatimonadaceae bacterium]